MEVADPLSIVPWGAYFPSAVTGAITSGPQGAMGPQSAASALIYSYVDIANARSVGTNFTLNITVVDYLNGGAVIGSSVTSQYLAAGLGWMRYTGTISLGQVNLWNTENRYMYLVETSIIVPGEGVIDSTTTRIGIRDAVSCYFQSSGDSDIAGQCLIVVIAT